MPESRPRPAAQTAIAPAARPLRVLLADDDRDGAMTLSTLLQLKGYEAARRLRQRYGDDGPVLIAVTGWKQASDKILASLAGFDHHVAKPYDPAALIGLLSKLGPR